MLHPSEQRIGPPVPTPKQQPQTPSCSNNGHFQVTTQASHAIRVTVCYVGRDKLDRRPSQVTGGRLTYMNAKV